MDDFFHKALHMADGVIRQVKEEDYTKATPCSEWDVRALMNHMFSEVAWVPPLLEGKTITEVGSAFDGDLIGNAPLQYWHKYMEQAMQAASSTPPEAVAHLSYTDKPVGAYLREVGGDLVIHGWDLARAIGIEFIFDAQTINEVKTGLQEVIQGGREAGMFGPAIDVTGTASDEEQLLAFCGRDINWGK